MLVCSSPKLIAAYHVLHRLSDPRHSPCALNCFKKITLCMLPYKVYYSIYNLLFSQYVKELNSNSQYAICNLQWKPADDKISNLQTLSQHPELEELLLIAYCQLLIANCQFIFCGGYRSRTDDPLRARQML